MYIVAQCRIAGCVAALLGDRDVGLVRSGAGLVAGGVC